jgi:hypothetical protein
MAIRCGNCRQYFTTDEIVRGKPPMHPWRVTPEGEQAVAANLARGGEHYPCPTCGARALLT